MATSSPSIHTRVESAQLIDNRSSPAETAVFLCMVLDYTEYLRSLTQIVSTDASTTVERDVAKYFVRLISHDHAWPLVQQIDQVYQYPMYSEPTGKHWLLDEVLAWIKERVKVPEVLLPVDDFSVWQRNKLWERVLLNLEYLTFGWDQETGETKQKMKEARDAVDKVRDIAGQLPPLDLFDDAND